MYANEILKSTLKIFGESWKQNWVTYCNLKISWIIESFLFYPKICASQIKEIQQAGLYFRDALLPNISTISWPPKHVELCESAVKLPEELDAFLYTLLTGNTHIPAEYPDRLRALLILLARTSFTELLQDYKNYSSKYCYRMPNNVQLIQMPHRCGYGIVPLPETIKPYINTTLAWDNIDRLEETLSGGVAKKPMARLDLTFLSLMTFKSHWMSSDISRISMYLLLTWLLFTRF